MLSLSPIVKLPDGLRSFAAGAMVAGALLVAGCGDSDGGDSAVVSSEAADAPSESDAAVSEPDGDDDPAASADSESPAEAADTADDGGADDDGISAEEAEETDVLTGDYDMLLSGPSSAEEVDGCLRFEITASNVGKEPDTYRIRSDVGTVDTGGQDPGAVTLDPGDEATIAVELCDSTTRSMSVQAFSDGLGGNLIDQLDLG